MTTSGSPAPDRRSRGPGGPRLFERGPFLDELEALFTRSLAVPSRCTAIEGPWGSGRTALINAAADLAGRAGCLVLRAKGGDLEERTPYAVLGRLVESADAWAAEDDIARGHVRRLEGLLAGRPGPADPTGIPSVFHRLVLHLRRTAPVLLAIDDADRADPQTLDALQYLVRRLDHQQIWVVVSARPLHPGVGLRPIDGLLTEPDTRQFILEPLRAGSVGAILTGFFEVEPDPRFVAACTEATGGSPFLLKALLPCLARGGITPTADMADSIEQVRAPKVTQVVLARLARLPSGTSELLRACAVIGEPADPSLARELADIDAASAERSADEAEQMELLRPGRPWRFHSPLIRWAVYHDVPRARRSELHSDAARLLDANGADEAAVAGHLLATEPIGTADTAERLQQIGRRALTAGAGGLARRCLERALAETPVAERRSRLYLDLAAAELPGREASALAHLQQAVDLGGSDGATVVRVALDLLDGLRGQPALADQALAMLEVMRMQLDGVARELRIELELALTWARDQPDQRIDGLSRLRALLAEAGGDETATTRLARSAVTLHDVLSSPTLGADDMAAALGAIVEVDQLASAEPMAGRVQTTALLGLLCADRFAEVDAALGSALAERSLPDRELVEERVQALSVLSLSWQGSLVAADEVCTRRSEGGDGAAPGPTPRPTTGHLDVLVQQGRIEDAERLAASTRSDQIEPALFRALSQIELGRLRLAQGAASPALELFEAAGETAAMAGIVNPAIVPWRADAALALATRGEWERAGRLADQNLRLARTFGAPRTTGIALRAAAAAAPDLTLRVELLTEAVEVLETSAARLEQAHALIDLGTTLIDLDRKEEARGVLRQGASLASRCGAHQLLEVAGERLRTAGARPRRLGLVGPESLTPAERRVVGKAADGLTNQRIADDLYVTLKTVEGHLAKAYRKLGVDGRADLAGALALGAVGGIRDVREDGDEVDSGEPGDTGPRFRVFRASAG